MKKQRVTEDTTKKQKKRIISVTGEEIKLRRTIRFWFIGIISLLFAVTCVLSTVLFIILYKIFEFQAIHLNGVLLITATSLSCMIIGSALSAVAVKYAFGRINKISAGMREIAKGNFKTRVEVMDKSKLSEFGELERNFNQMASDLDSIEIFRNDFTNNFSHEFKTPIVSIRGFARQLQSGNLTEEQRKEYIEIIVDESERLANMSTNVLLLTKLENQQIVSDKTYFDLDEQIRRCVLLLERSWSEKNIEFDLDLDDVEYYFNEEMLSEVWINLFSNAIKFTNDGGNISCKLRQEDSCVIFTICDNGIGMNKETLDRIFEKFYQGDTSHAVKGNGIGLNIVHRVITLAHGDISVESEMGVGSTFTVRLPL